MKLHLSKHQKLMAMNASVILAFLLGVNLCVNIMRNGHQYWLRPANVLNIEYNQILSESLFRDGALHVSFESAFLSGLGRHSVFAKAIFPVEAFAAFDESIGKWTHLISNSDNNVKQTVEGFLPIFNLDKHKIQNVRLANDFFCRIIIMEPRGDEIDVYMHTETRDANFGARFNSLFPDRL
jgi:hypothetical protein